MPSNKQQWPGGDGTMKVFIGEYISGGGCAAIPLPDLPGSLLAEGTAMCRAICEDAGRCAQVTVAVDSRFCGRPPHDRTADVRMLPIDSSGPMIDQWLNAASDCDAVIVIAPETDRVLADIAASFRRHRHNVVAGSAAFIDAAADKRRLSRVMRNASVPHPVIRDIDCAAAADDAHEWILKPIDGCGSSNIRRFDSFAQAEEARKRRTGDWIIQAFHPGLPVSIAAIMTAGRLDWLPACEQRLDPTSFRYQGGRSPLAEPLHQRARLQADAAIRALLAAEDRTVKLPAQMGFVGVDLVLGEDSRDDVVIEVNPRLTTSYVGLRHLLKNNLAAGMLGLEDAAPQRDPAVASIVWDAGGMIYKGRR